MDVANATANATTLVCERIEANPDVSGVGIRISLYTLCLGGRILNFLVTLFASDKNSEKNSVDFVRSTTAALSIQGLSLLFTSMVQAFQNQLTLFHAIVVLHLLALLGINLASRGRYSGNDLWRWLVDTVLVSLTVMLFIAFNVYVWIKARDLGPQPECNAETVYVIFGVSVNATADVFRYIILATFAAVPAAFIVVLVCGLPCWVAVCCGGRGSGGSLRRSCKEGCLGCFHISGGSGGSDIRPERRGDAASVRTSDTVKANMLITAGIQTLAYSAFSVYCIVSLEQMIERNKVSHEEHEWTFGQMIAIFLLLGTTYELWTVIISSLGGGDRGHQDDRSIRL